MNHASNLFPKSQVKAACVATISDIEHERRQYCERLLQRATEPFRWFWIGPKSQFTRDEAIEFIEMSNDGQEWGNGYYGQAVRPGEYAISKAFLGICEVSKQDQIWLSTDEFVAIGMERHG